MSTFEYLQKVAEKTGTELIPPPSAASLPPAAFMTLQNAQRDWADQRAAQEAADRAGKLEMARRQLRRSLETRAVPTPAGSGDGWPGPLSLSGQKQPGSPATSGEGWPDSLSLSGQKQPFSDFTLSGRPRTKPLPKPSMFSRMQQYWKTLPDWAKYLGVGATGLGGASMAYDLAGLQAPNMRRALIMALLGAGVGGLGYAFQPQIQQQWAAMQSPKPKT